MTVSILAPRAKNRPRPNFISGNSVLSPTLQAKTRASQRASITMPKTGPAYQFSFDPNSIVDVTVQTVQAPTPNTFQQTGCMVSFGGTNIATMDMEEITQISDLSDYVTGPQGIASMVWSTGEVTVTTLAPMIPAYTPTETPTISVSGAVPTGYNYMGPVTIVTASSFTYPVAVDPGTILTQGMFQSQSEIEISQMVSTYFAQGNRNSVWVLELGYSSTDATNATQLSDFLKNNQLLFCGYLLPRSCGATVGSITAYESIFKSYQNPEAMTYFWLTVTPATLNVLDATYKCVIQFVEAPSVTDTTQPNISNPNGEFTCAAMFYNAISFKASSVNPVAPMAFKYVYGVTAYPTQNMSTILLQFKSTFTNYVATGAEGGIAYTILYQGVTRDGFDYFNWWWTIDWVQININLNLSNAIVNGSNNALAPLYYNQSGINFLETVLYGTMRTASIFGMVVGQIVMTNLDTPILVDNINQGVYSGQCNVNAVPFANYTTANPGDFRIGEYDGLSALFIPARGFIHIQVSIVASSLVTV